MANNLLVSLILSARDNSPKVFKSFTSNVLNAKTALVGLGAAVTATLLGSSVKDAIQNTLDQADSLQKLSIRLGISTEALSQYQHVVGLSGVSFEKFTTGIQRSTRRIAEAEQGTGVAVDALKELNIAIEDIAGLSPDQQFELIAAAMSKLENESDKVRLAMKLFDTEGVALIQTMTGGAAGIKQMRAEADKLGLTLSRTAADDAANANDALARFQAIIDGIVQRVATNFAPTLETIANTLRDKLTPAAGQFSDAFTVALEEAGNIVAEFIAKADFASAAESVGSFASNLAQSFADIKNVVEIGQTTLDAFWNSFSAGINSIFALLTAGANAIAEFVNKSVVALNRLGVVNDDIAAKITNSMDLVIDTHDRFSKAAVNDAEEARQAYAKLGTEILDTGQKAVTAEEELTTAAKERVKATKEAEQAAIDRVTAENQALAAQQAAAKATADHTRKLEDLQQAYKTALAAGDTQAAAQALIDLQTVLDDTAAAAGNAAITIKDRFKAANLDMQSDLEENKNQLKDLYTDLRESGTAAAADIKKAFLAYADAARAAAEGQSAAEREALENALALEAAQLGITKATEQRLDTSKKAAEAINKESDAMQDLGSSIADANNQMGDLENATDTAAQNISYSISEITTNIGDLQRALNNQTASIWLREQNAGFQELAQQTLKVQSLVQAMDALAISENVTARQLGLLADQAKRTIPSLDRIAENDLDTVNKATDNLIAKMIRLQGESEKAGQQLEDLLRRQQDEIDRAQGELDRIARRNYQDEIANIDALAKAAGDAGNRTAAQARANAEKLFRQELANIAATQQAKTQAEQNQAAQTAQQTQNAVAPSNLGAGAPERTYRIELGTATGIAPLDVTPDQAETLLSLLGSEKNNLVLGT